MTEATSRPISRRTVAKGAAWTAPVILGGIAAPAYAASLPPVNPSLDPNGFCKHPQDKVYHVGVKWTNTLGCTTTVTITSIVLTPFSGSLVTFPTPAPFSVAAGGTSSVVYHSNESDNSANGTVTVQYKFTNCATPTPEIVTATVPLSAPTLPPCDNKLPW